ncbi:mercuric transport protein MerTP [Pontibacter sp. FD36]|uniref:mercuric transport protein MerTP n=1 Tax=Pontibacter sp. FD36 TaxID=2789860 RepID=UPI0018AC5D6A|nr:mercuric transport protein MerTP [Pontibacter sp. FD36]MBF8965507.1 mercuric transport protein MerTP [Pontibacter sp. FD36]
MKPAFPNLIGGGLLAAVFASLCCIAPLLAVVGGATGALSTFSWVEPLRPYLIGVTVALLAGAWYQRLRKPKADVDCACDEEEKPVFWKTKAFLLVVTVLAVIFLAFPYYADAFYEKPAYAETSQETVKQTLHLQIKGMTCTGCEAHVNQEVGKLPGIMGVSTSYEQESATVTYDSTQVQPSTILEAARKTGYVVKLEED